VCGSNELHPCTVRSFTCAETRFHLSPKHTSPFKSAGASVQSITDSRGVCISCSNTGYTVYHASVKNTGYPLHSPVSPSLPLLCVTVCHHISTGVYTCISCISYSSTLPICLQGIDRGNFTFTLKYTRQSRNIYCICYTPGVDKFQVPGCFDG